MGPVIRAEHRDRVASYLDIAKSEGASVALDGRREFDERRLPPRPERRRPRRPRHARLATKKSSARSSPSSAPATWTKPSPSARSCEYGNGAAIFTRSGYAARQFKRHFNAGMIGINVGVPAPMAWFPFTGWNRSFFGDLHIQGNESISSTPAKK